MGFFVARPAQFSIQPGFSFKKRTPSSSAVIRHFFGFLPKLNSPRNANVANDKITTASVNPAPRNPAPTGLIGDKAAEWACCAASASAPHPLLCEFWQTLHQSAVVFTAEGYDSRGQFNAPSAKRQLKAVEKVLTATVSIKTESGTSPVRPKKLYVVKSAVPFLKLNRIRGSPPELGWRTSNATTEA